MVVKKEAKKGETKKKLTTKQKKFTAEYIRTGNGTQSAIKAGYSKKSARVVACRNITNANIKETIQTAAEKLGINSEFVLGNIKRATEISGKLYQKTVGNGENVAFVEDMVDSQTFLKANDLLGKHLKLFTDQIEIKAEVKTEDQELTDAVRQLLFLATQS
jgi:phage terminase small subunit